MLALHPQARRIEGRGLYPSLFAFLCLSAILVHPPNAMAHSGPAKSSSLSAKLINLEATSKETFRYNASLYNGQNRPVIYDLQATAPPGWNTSFRIDGMQVTSFRLDSNRTQDISIEFTPSPTTKPGKYEIPVVAVSDEGKLELNLEAVVKGSYSLELTTPTGVLSDEVTEGSRKPIYLTLKNEGSLPLDNVDLTAQTPAKWNVTFEPSKVERLDPGKSINVVAQLNVPDKTIAGDYITKFTASNANATTDTSYRLTVTTSWLTGWLGVLVIVIAIGIVYLLIRKYGRR